MYVYKYLGQYLFVNKYLLNKIMVTNGYIPESKILIVWETGGRLVSLG